jgi:hypothetical protein
MQVMTSLFMPSCSSMVRNIIGLCARATVAANVATIMMLIASSLVL